MAFFKTISGGLQTARIVAAMIPALRAPPGEEGERARRRLAQVLGRMRGLPTKVGQWLAGGAHGDDFAECTEELAPLPWSRMRPVLAAAWGFPTEQALARVEETGRAASIGQVHRATLTDGREVAIKIQYPGIRGDIESTLAALELIPQLGPVRRHGIDLDAHRQQLRATLDHELDYRSEAAAQERAAAAASSEVLVPRVYAELSRETILVQDWVEGIALGEAAAWPVADRDAAGGALVRRLLRQVLVEGLLHADPHPGNLRLRRPGAGALIVQYDHGCMVDIPRPLAEALRALVVCARSGAGDPLVHLAAAGFAADKLAPIAARLPQVLAILLQPLVVAGPCRAAEWHPATTIAAALGADRWWFRAAGRPELFLLTRAFGGLIRQLQRLDATVDWGECWTRVVGVPLPPPASHQPAVRPGLEARA